jgi:Ca-activated chloride channel homolog
MIEFLRPGGLLALPIAALLAWAWWRARAGLGAWRRVVDPALLGELADRAPSAHNRLALGLGFAVLALVCAALAGPSWREQPVALQRDAGARIVVLDLSPSMNAVDVAPSRLARAREAAGELLARAAGAKLGVVVFGADAFSVAPLTADPAVLAHLLEGASPRILPRAGSRPDLALELARAMLAEAGLEQGEVILVGDSAGDARALEAARALERAGFPVSVLAVGTAHGGPVRVAAGAFARTEAGEVLIARPELEGLERLARAGGGRFRLLADETPRFARVAQGWRLAAAASDAPAAGRQDDGALLALLALPLAALLFRRGWLACVAALCIALPAPPAHAFDWADLWRRADQRAERAFAERRALEAERLLGRLGPDSPWRAPLLYRAGRYAQAEALYAAEDTAAAHYNRGNALALAGRLEAALEAYGAALERSPSMRDARHNRALVRQALEARRAQAARSGDGDERREGARGEGRAPRPRDATRASRGKADWDEPGRPAAAERRSPARGEARGSNESPEQAELRRLEALLAQVPDDPGGLLANRFAKELRLRGAPHDDTGAAW